MDKIINRIGRVAEAGKVDFLSREIMELGHDQVLIKIISSAVCGSDLHIFKGRHPSAALPVTIGHEFSGDVKAAGPSVTKIKTGDRVTVEPVLTCGECEACKSGNYGYCEKISYTYRNGDGAMADYIIVNADRVFPLPAHLSYDSAALIEPLSVAVHAVRRADIKLGDKILILGAGTIGLLITAVCRKNGATDVIVVDHSQKKLDLAKTFGATAVINSKKTDPFPTLNEITQGKGADKSFECVGVQETLVQAIMGLRKNGLATIIGIFENQEVVIPISRFVTHEIKVQGSQGYCRDFPTAIELSKEIELDKLITHTFKLENLQEALETCLDRTADAVKVIVKP